MSDPLVVVGGGAAGAAAATALRQEGGDEPVVLVGAEPHLPYERPPLSKGALQQEVPLEQLWLHPPAHWEQHDVELRLGATAARLDPAQRILELTGGERLRYHRLLLATGGRPRRPPIPGLDLDGVCVLRTVDDAAAIRRRAEHATRAVVIGLGFIGCEVAASLRTRGLEVTAIEPQVQPLASVLGETVGAAVADLHRERGLHLQLGDAVDHLDGDGRLEAVVTRGGRRIPCDLAVVGLGIQPATELAETAGLAIDDGIVVDGYARTSADGVYAAGDVARHHHPLLDRHIRVEHWTHALKHGQAAAHSMLDRLDEPYQELPWFWSDQYDTTLQYVGAAAAWDELVVRGDPASGRFSAFYLADGRLRAAAALNQPRDVRAATRLIAAGVDPTPAELADESVDLRQLARHGTPAR